MSWHVGVYLSRTGVEMFQANANYPAQLVQVSPSLCGYTFGVALMGKQAPFRHRDGQHPEVEGEQLDSGSDP